MATGDGRRPDATVAVAAAVTSVLTAPWWQVDDAGIRSAVVELDRQAARLDAARARLLAEADERGVGGASGAPSTSDWLAATTGERPERARARLVLSRALQGVMAPTGAALAAGTLTWDHAEVVRRNLSRLPADVDSATRDEAQAFLVEHACERSDAGGTCTPGLDPRRLARLGDALRHRLDPDAGERLARDEDAAVSLRTLTCVETDDGTWVLHGCLDPVLGATLRTALDARNAPRPAGPEGRIDTRPRRQRDADALATVLDEWAADGLMPQEHRDTEGGGAGTTGDTGRTGDTGIREDDRSSERTRLPGRDRDLSLPKAARRGPGLASRPTLVVTASAETLTVAPGTPGVDPARCRGLVLSAATAQVLACDARVVPVLLAPDGTPLDVGRARYTFPAAVRAAVLVRDDHACSRCHRRDLPLQVHHLQAFSRGGPTSERNGTAVCPPCHRVVHRHGWRGEVLGDQVVWHPPDRTPAHLPPPPWRPALAALVERWLDRTVRAPGRRSA